MKCVQLPDHLCQCAAQLAEVDHGSVDRLVDALAYEGVGDWAGVQACAERGSLEKLKRVLSKVSDVLRFDTLLRMFNLQILKAVEKSDSASTKSFIAKLL